MFNEVLLGKKPSVLDPALASVQSALADTMPQPVAEPKGIRGFFQQAQRPGGFFERLGTFGAQLQDINDGGNRVAQQEQLGLRRQAAALEEQEAADKARIRTQINELAGGLGLNGTDRLRFLVDPEGLLKDRWEGEQPKESTVLNTREGVYEYNNGQGRYLERFAPEKPSAPAGYRFNDQGALDFIPGGPADPRVIGSRAAAGRAPPRASGGGRSAPSGRVPQSSTPSRRPWERSW